MHNSSRGEDTVGGPGADADPLHELLVELLRYASVLHPDQPARGHPVPMTQVFALHELDTGAGLSQRDLADRLGLEKSTVSRLVAEMETAGLLKRERHPDNRRYYRLRLTARGRAAHARMGNAFHDRYHRLVSMMTTSERDALRTGLAALIRVLRQASQQ
jgi:DNA-binding MarR family transcriptional regulator